MNNFFKIKIIGNNIKGYAMKVAFATKDLENINDHFGWAKQFAIYEISKDGSSLVEVVKTAEDIEDENSKIESKIEALKGASIVYCEAIGSTAAAKVVQNRIHPMKVTEPTSIQSAISSLKNMLNGNPPPWIKRIVANEGGAL
ncbi:MAG: nitrogen fixation protein NifX [Campylobacterales bacterium]|nr:nitrogen fixation protein NifX [Campylobacterales bacterium]